jgi:glucose 1-dehydrogenase
MSRTVLITGVSGGVGGAAARAFAAAGWEVIGIDRRPATGVPGRFFEADSADPAAITAVAGEIKQTVRRLEALVNNAAVQICRPLVETTLEEWRDVMDTNVRAAYLFARELYPLLRKGGGAIVNVSSVHAVATSAGLAAYATSKGALLAMTRAMAIEMAKDGIRVNAVLPGAVDTAMLRAGLSRGQLKDDETEAALRELARRTVIGRVGKPEEIAQAILFLADSERSSFITGQPLIVDGGATAKLSTE